MNDHTSKPDLGVNYHHGPVPFEQVVFSDECPDEEDFDWASDNLELRQLYGGLFVAVRQRLVWGVGQTPQSAWEAAQQKPDCPPVAEFAFVPISGLPLKDMPDRKERS